MSLADIMTVKAYAALDAGEDLPEPIMDKLYEHFLNNGEMPYGVAKARDGDPNQWIYDRLYEDR